MVINCLKEFVPEVSNTCTFCVTQTLTKNVCEFTIRSDFAAQKFCSFESQFLL